MTARRCESGGVQRAQKIYFCIVILSWFFCCFVSYFGTVLGCKVLILLDRMFVHRPVRGAKNIKGLEKFTLWPFFNTQQYTQHLTPKTVKSGLLIGPGRLSDHATEKGPRSSPRPTILISLAMRTWASLFPKLTPFLRVFLRPQLFPLPLPRLVITIYVELNINSDWIKAPMPQLNRLRINRGKHSRPFLFQVTAYPGGQGNCPCPYCP